MLDLLDIQTNQAFFEQRIETHMKAVNANRMDLRSLLDTKRMEGAAHLGEKFINLKTLLDIANAEMVKYQASEAPDFNVFRILGFERYEVLTHTPFLADLLSPSGAHGQGPLFLRTFLTQILRFPDEEAGHPSWYVQREMERIDLRIVNTALRCAVFIENKIDTSAHSGQLSRYFDLWKKCYQRGAFVYLTLHGDDPPEKGFNDDIYHKDCILSELMRLSYKHNIFGWLEVCLTEIQSDKVRHTVRQYLDLIRNL